MGQPSSDSTNRSMKAGLSDQGFAYLMVLPPFALVLLLTLYPLADSMWLSMHDVNLFLGRVSFNWGFNYAEAIRSAATINSLAITLRFTLETVLFCLAVGLAMAILLNQALPCRGLLRSIAILPLAMAEFATGIVWRFLFSEQNGFVNGVLYSLGLVDEYQNFLSESFVVELLSLAFAWRIVPLAAFLLLAGLQSIPEGIYSAARVDGLGPWARFSKITLPSLRPAVLVTLVFVTLEATRALDIVLTLSFGGPGAASQTLTYLTYRNFFLDLKLGYGAALSYFPIILTGCLVGLYFLLVGKRGR